MTRALAQTLTPVLEPQIPAACTHIAGHGGATGAIRQVLRALPDFPFVFKTDVQRYYASIDQEILMTQLGEQVIEPVILRLVWQAIRRISWDDGCYREHRRGIALGCPLSPLLGGVHLADTDRAMRDQRWFYVRFIDDLLVLAPSRPRLREAVKRLHGLFGSLRLRMHPDETFIGRWERGFDFLGMRLSRLDAEPEAEAVDASVLERAGNESGDDGAMTAPVANAPPMLQRSCSLSCNTGAHGRPCRELIAVAEASWRRFVDRCRRLYEQGAPATRIDGCVRAWRRWFGSGGSGRIGDGVILDATNVLPRDCAESRSTHP